MVPFSILEIPYYKAASSDGKSIGTNSIVSIPHHNTVCFKRNVSEDVNEERGNVRMLEIP